MDILAYFSHSYKPADREINSFFWELFNEEHFFFTVDRKSKVFSIPYLESMMTLSNCFVAVIPLRNNAPNLCSPYILFEYGLAVQARKPALVFVEQGVEGSVFRGDPRIVPFNRNRLHDQKEGFRARIQKLAKEVGEVDNPDQRLRQPCGLVIGSGPDVERVYTPALIRRLKTELKKYSRKLEVVQLDFDASYQFSLLLDKYDFLIVEIRESLHVPWLAGYLLGRAVPTIRVCHVAPGESRADVPVPQIIEKHKPENTDEEPVSYWTDESELLQGVTTHVHKFNLQRDEFHTKEEGLRYFNRAGRQDATVFISNASPSRAIAARLTARLKDDYIDFFHYEVKDAIRVGEVWLQELVHRIEDSSIFVALVGRDYVLSQWCRYELETARRRAAEGQLKIYAYVLDDDAKSLLADLGIGHLQTIDFTGPQPEARVDEIVAALDGELKRMPARPADAGKKAEPPSTARTLAALVLGEKERSTLVDVLEKRLRSEDGAARSAWVKGLLTRAGLYEALGGEDFTGSAQAVALALVTKTESRGTLRDGRNAASLLVAALAMPGQVTHDASSFLQELGGRLQRQSAPAGI